MSIDDQSPDQIDGSAASETINDMLRPNPRLDTGDSSESLRDRRIVSAVALAVAVVLSVIVGIWLLGGDDAATNTSEDDVITTGANDEAEPTSAPTASPTTAVAPSDPATTDPTTADPERVVHTVAAGDTLGAIAERYNVTLDGIYQVNPGIVGSVLQVGQLVNLPPEGLVLEDASPLPAATPIPRSPGEAPFHEVVTGDTLLDIASTYGVTVDKLMAANEIENEDTVIVGQRLLLPPPGG